MLQETIKIRSEIGIGDRDRRSYNHVGNSAFSCKADGQNLEPQLHGSNATKRELGPKLGVLVVGVAAKTHETDTVRDSTPLRLYRASGYKATKYRRFEAGAYNCSWL